jgi:hypothetical protein
LALSDTVLIVKVADMLYHLLVALSQFIYLSVFFVEPQQIACAQKIACDFVQMRQVSYNFPFQERSGPETTSGAIYEVNDRRALDLHQNIPQIQIPMNKLMIMHFMDMGGNLIDYWIQPLSIFYQFSVTT